MASIAQAAKHIKMNEINFKVLLDSEVIPRASRNNYDLTTVREIYIEHLRAEASGRGEDGSGDLTAARTRKATAEAEAAERKNKIDEAEWVSCDDVGKMFESQIMVSREILLTMIGKIGAALGPEAELVARDEVHDALNELANPYSDAQRKAQRAEGPIFGQEFDEKEFDKKKAEYEAEQAEKKRKAASSRTFVDHYPYDSNSNEIASCSCRDKSLCSHPDSCRVHKEWKARHA
jgi:hypothetical protein